MSDGASADRNATRRSGWHFFKKRALSPSQTRQLELRRRYKIDFSEHGEVAYRISAATAHGADLSLHCRAPSLLELDTIEQAVLHSDPSHLNRDGTQGVKFYFLQRMDPVFAGAVAWYFPSDKNGRPAVFYRPGVETFPVPSGVAGATAEERRRSTLLAVTIHELAHNGQRNAGWHDDEGKGILPCEFGWLPLYDAHSQKLTWLLRGAGGAVFRRNPVGNWVRCNLSGQPLDYEGKLVDAEARAYTRAPAAMRRAALVRPVSTYFSNPLEMGAEAMLWFRLNRQYRGSLFSNSETLYDFVRRHDAREIVRAYGVNERQLPRFIRSADGLLVPNTPANAEELLAFENSLRTHKRSDR